MLQAQEPGYSLAVLDSDVVAAALDRSLDRWMQSRADLQFYERITGEEVMAGNYIAKNRPWVRAFLQQWASMKDRQPPGFSSADNGALHVVLVETLELSGAGRVRELYGGLEAKVDNLQPYWSFVEASMRVLGPPRMWRMEQTSLGREHSCSAEASCLLAIWPRMSFFVDDGVYLNKHVSSVGPVMHHGIKDPRDVAEVYFSDLTQCIVNRSVVVTAQKMGQEALNLAEGYSGLYPQGPGCSGPQCAEHCVANFTCEPLAPDVALGSLSFVQEASETQATRRVRRHAALAVGADGTARALHEEEEALKTALSQATEGASRAAAAASAAALAAEEAAKAASAGGPRSVIRKDDKQALEPSDRGMHPIGLVVLADGQFQKQYGTQIQSLRCYAQQQGYDLWLLNGSAFPKCIAFRGDFFYLKHCAVAEFLETQADGYTAVVLDADVCAVALERGLDDWMRGPGELQFYERMGGPEVMAGNYIAKNVPWVREFLRRWAFLRSHKPPGFSSADNGALHVMLVNILELEGAVQVNELYGNLTATVDSLEPYWHFVHTAKKVLGPPRAWKLGSTGFGHRHCRGFWSTSCTLTIWPRMQFFVDDGVYLNRRASNLIGPVMHHGIKDAADVREHYFRDVWSCLANGDVLVSPDTLGSTAVQFAASHPELYQPEHQGCTGTACVEACVANFSCRPIEDFEAPLMRQWQRDAESAWVVFRRMVCFGLAAVVVVLLACLTSGKTAFRSTGWKA